MAIEIQNAVIASTYLTVEEHHGIMDAGVVLDYGGAGQGFGGWVLDTPVKDANGKFLHREGTAFGCEFIRRLVKTVGVTSWEALKGCSVRVKSEHSKVHAIGHYLKDDWFDPAVLAAEMRPSESEPT